MPPRQRNNFQKSFFAGSNNTEEIKLQQGTTEVHDEELPGWLLHMMCLAGADFCVSKWPVATVAVSHTASQMKIIAPCQALQR